MSMKKRNRSLIPVPLFISVLSSYAAAKNSF